MKIWIVQGTSGEYSDRGEWIVDAWPTEDAAKARVAALDALLLEHGYKHGGGSSDGDYLTQRARMDAFKVLAGDPCFSADYTGTSYWLTECELHDGQ